MSAIATVLALLAPLLTPSTQRQPTRVGVLNTGELVLVDASGATQVISQATTELIRGQLIHTDFADSELLLFPTDGALGSEKPRGSA